MHKVTTAEIGADGETQPTNVAGERPLVERLVANDERAHSLAAEGLARFFIEMDRER